MPIRRLAPLLVNQIAAGEVIERPASVVKELVENAVDAGARRITVAIEEGGKALIRVADDGSGIPFDELTLALAPHATSKIETSEDLERIATMGFRGEALASIASISRISVLSRPTGEDRGAVVEGEADAISEPRPAASAPGTTITVRNLFFNTPARRKFLKTDQTESGRIVEMLEGLALSHPAAAFTLTVDGRPRMDLPPDQSPRDRTLGVLGRELADELLEIADEAGSDVGEIGLWGLAGTPSIARGTGRHQRVYVNGRLVADRSIAHAIKEAYRGLIEPTRTPTIVLFLVMDPELVDVNVHPTKAEVRFRNQSAVHRRVLSAIRAVLAKADLTPAFDAGAPALPLTAFSTPPGPEPAFGTGRSSAGPRTRAVVDTLRSLDPQQKGIVYSELKAALAREAPEILEREIMEGGAARRDDEGGERLPVVRQVSTVLQVHSSYIVTEDEQGMLIIDQHALHERVMFQKLKDRLDVGALEAQRLLVPAVVSADAAQVEKLESLAPLLARLGIEAELMGPSTVAVHAFTSLLFERGVDPVTFMQEVLARAAGAGLGEPGSDDPEAALHEVLDMMACKAAIKAGDRLEPKEIEELLEYRDTVERSSNCPHGRPTTLRLTLRDLERQFGRR